MGGVQLHMQQRAKNMLELYFVRIEINAIVRYAYYNKERVQQV